MFSRSRLKTILSLKHKKYRSQQNMFLIEGYRLCQEALLSDFTLEMMLISSDILSPRKVEELTAIAQNRGIEIVEIKQHDVRKLAATSHPQGVFCVVRQFQIDVESVLQKEMKHVVIIDEGQDPGNTGTIIRICDWFGINAVFLSRGSVELFNPKLVRSTMGSLFHLPIVANVDVEFLLIRLKKMGFQILASDVDGNVLYHQVDYRPPLALIFGNENRGIRKSWSSLFDKTIKIPPSGRAESLNMAVAAGIIISRIVN